MKLLSTALLTILIGYLLLTAYVYWRQDKLIYFPDFPSRQVTMTPASIGLDYENIQLTAADGTELHGWFVPQQAARPVVVFFHGNAGNISHRLETLSLIHQLGASVLIIDYRGYGKSQGKPSEPGTYQDADTAWNYLIQQRQYKAGDIVIWGRSLGAAIAANLAARQQSKAVILESTFTSALDLAQQLYPLLPVRYISRYEYNVKQSIRDIHSPILFVHSRDDEIIPFSHGKQLFEQANPPKYFTELRGSHDNGQRLSRPQYEAGLHAFFDTLASPH